VAVVRPRWGTDDRRRQRAAVLAFAVALFAFVLPFATVSCDEAQVEATGADLVLRSAPDEEGTREEDFELGDLVVAYGGGLATAAFLAFALSLLAAVRGWNGGWATLAGLVGVSALVILKTRGGGGGESIAEVDTKAGGILAAGAGAAGFLVAGAAWLGGKERPSLKPVAPVAAAALVLFGYLYPVEHAPPLSVAYVDSLDLRNPWDGVFWLLPVLVGILFLARRQGVPRGLAALSVGVLAVVGVDVADEIGHYWREEDRSVGIAPVVFLAGMITAAAWAIVGQWRRLAHPAFVPLAAGLALGLAAWAVSPANA
jgi:hypothetical protein